MTQPNQWQAPPDKPSADVLRMKAFPRDDTGKPVERAKGLESARVDKRTDQLRTGAKPLGVDMLNPGDDLVVYVNGAAHRARLIQRRGDRLDVRYGGGLATISPSEAYSMDDLAEEPVTAAGPGNPEALAQWFEDGADGQIDWGQPGDFDDCVSIAAQYMDEDQAKGYCNLRHQAAVGGAPGTEEHAAAPTIQERVEQLEATVLRLAHVEFIAVDPKVTRQWNESQDRQKAAEDAKDRSGYDRIMPLATDYESLYKGGMFGGKYKGERPVEDPKEVIDKALGSKTYSGANSGLGKPVERVRAWAEENKDKIAKIERDMEHAIKSGMISDKAKEQIAEGKWKPHSPAMRDAMERGVGKSESSGSGDPGDQPRAPAGDSDGGQWVKA